MSPAGHAKGESPGHGRHLTEITLRTDLPAFHVWLEAPGRRGRFSDNGFLLLPDRPATVIFAPTDGSGPLPPDGIKVAHLAGVV